MELSVQEYQYLVSEITRETGAKRDGSGKNLIVPRCPFCGKSGGKFGIYIGKATAHRRPFMAHCFSCGGIHPYIGATSGGYRSHGPDGFADS